MSEEMKKKVFDYYHAYYTMTPVTNLLEEDVEIAYDDLPISVKEWRKKQEAK